MDNKNERLNKAATVLSKIMEISYWVAAGLLTASLAAYFFNEKLLQYFLNIGNGEFTVAGYSIQVLDEAGNLITAAFVAALIAGIIVCGFTAMIFRNIYLIFKTAAGKTKFSKGQTPFQLDNVRMLREIGIFAISIPLVEWICDTIIKVIVDIEIVESSISLTGVVLGIVLLCLSQFFAYGTQLQSDSDGLL